MKLLEPSSLLYLSNKKVKFIKKIALGLSTQLVTTSSHFYKTNRKKFEVSDFRRLEDLGMNYKLAINFIQYIFQYSFPIICANEFGLFKEM